MVARSLLAAVKQGEECFVHRPVRRDQFDSVMCYIENTCRSVDEPVDPDLEVKLKANIQNLEANIQNLEV